MSEPYKIAFSRLTAKVRQMRALQRQQQKQGNWFSLQDKQKLWKLQREVDNMLLLDEQGIKAFEKNNL